MFRQIKIEYNNLNRRKNDEEQYMVIEELKSSNQYDMHTLSNVQYKTPKKVID